MFGFAAFVNKENQVKLDGSDGKPDMRISLSADGQGTWVRDTSGALQLVLGTLEQPKLGDGVGDFYSKLGGDITCHSEVAVAREYLHTRLGQPCTVALRDYYPGWAAQKRTAEGGKVKKLWMSVRVSCACVCE